MSEQPQPLGQSILDSRVYTKRTPDRGNGLFAGDNIPARALVLSVSKPLMLALESSKLQDICYQCFRPDEASKESAAGVEQEAVKLRGCTGCRVVKFCNKDCQKLAWSQYHKLECKMFATLYPRVLPGTVRAIVRLLKQHKAGILPTGEYEQLFSLESHQDNLRSAGGQSWQDLFLMVRAAQSYSRTDESIDVVLRICCILMLNSFTLTTPTFDPLGIVFHPFPALVNHSCEPNAIVRFDASSPNEVSQSTHPRYGSVSIQALRNIAKDEEITIMYVDATFPFSNRQAELQERYFFTCTCPLCLQGTNAAPDRFLTASDSPSDVGPTTLRTKVNGKCLAEYLGTAEAVFRTVQSKPGSEEAQIPHIQLALRALAKTKIWPLSRYPFPQLRQQLLLALLTMQRFDEALTQSSILVRLVDPVTFDEPYHPIRLTHKWTFWNLCQCLMTEYMELGRQKEEEGRMLSLMSCMVIEDLMGVLGKGEIKGELEKTVTAAYQNVRADEWTWGAYEKGGEGLKERVWAWWDGRIQKRLVTEAEGD